MQSHLPQTCILCNGRVIGRQICPSCEADLPELSSSCCPQCALPTLNGEICGACLKRPPSFDRTQAAFAYAFPIDTLVQQCKYAHAIALTAYFAEHMAQRFKLDRGADCLIPMPLHPTRLTGHGFNQAAEIARRLSPMIGIPWRGDACRRVRDTPSQAGLNLKSRKRNLRDAFAIDMDVRGKRIILIDDVMTSGSSLNELARTVRKAGALEIQAWVLARTL